MATPRTSRYEDVDDLDRQIIAVLKDNGRASNQKIAQKLGLSPAAVGARVRRLEKERMLRVVVVADFEVIGCDLLLAVGIRVERRDPRSVARDLAALPEVFSCSLMAGVHNIEALIALPDVDALKDFMENKLANIAGISEFSAEVVVDMLKYEFDVVPFTR
ncbi:MAG: putative HTH-type transcriptional regulator [Bradyrhizobium sp.]|nr:putative HTH-type transcriptional regulator [Bradyrhizobium sp.]